ncbi:hypothetical protein HC028_18875 [Planosporangium flavigriseum]|uniref:Uncharacterized protein n=1 Tax=Planosporangium flavigriseum TaxID=373681 RepID=A0A8J3PL28_9ACTN|nr:hypothetical protein [Planosporangium flavigriseum]NJC66554.1 hypothetical protein [Planosporangium flavigriseum]GIG73427.1 hypothetical protein Pfl04_18310 [Planosporangium flavigriseum]
MPNARKRSAGPPPRGGTARPWRAVAVAAVVAFCVGALLAGGGGYAAGRPDQVQQTVQTLQAQDAARDKAQIKELTATARELQGKLLPVLSEMAAAMPIDPQAAAKPATAAQVASWRAATGAAVERFAHPPSGGTGVNIARSGLANAVRGLDAAVRTYEASLSAPPATQQALVSLAANQRDIAVATWSTGGTQLDVANIDAGFGHAHVFLPAAPGSGALTADGETEGHHD